MRRLALTLVLSLAACLDLSSVPCARDENCPNGFVCSCERVCVASSTAPVGCAGGDAGIGGGAAAGGRAGGASGGGTSAGGSAGGMSAGGMSAGGLAGGGVTGGGESGGGAAGGGESGGNAAGGVTGGGAAGGAPLDAGVTGGAGVPGDDCVTAIPLSFTGSTTTSGSLVGLRDDSTACAGTGPDAVYQVNLSSPATLTAQVTASGFTPRVSVRSACASSVTLACEAAAVPGTATASTSRLAAGTYFVWVDAPSASSAGPYSLTVSAAAVDAGPGSLSTFNVTVMNQTVTVDQYLPAGLGPFPVIALGHGYSLGRNSLGALATALRDDGFVVVVPQFPSLSTNATLHSQMLLASVDRVLDAGVAAPGNLGLGGQSGGALSAWLAAAQRPTRALVLLDPLDDSSSTGLAQAANVQAPALFLFAQPSQACNANNNAASWFAPKPGRKTRLTVAGSNSCDPADPVTAVCSATCGIPAAPRTAVFRRYARAHFGRELLGPTLFSCVDPVVVRDVDAGVVTAAVTSLGCP